MPALPKSDAARLEMLVAITIAVNVSFGVLCMGVATLIDRPISAQFDRIITLMVGGLLGFLTKAGIDYARAGKVTVENSDTDPIPVKQKK